MSPAAAILDVLRLADDLGAHLLLASAETAVLALAVGGLCVCLRGRAARLRAVLWAIVLLKPLVALGFGAPLPLLSLEAPQQLPAAIEPAPGPFLAELAMTVESSRPSLTAAGWLGLIWLAGLGFVGWAALGEGIRVRRLLRGSRAAPSELQTHYRRLAGKLGVRRPPPLRLSTELGSPALIGSVRPRIVVPVWLVERGAGAELDWALAHELIHLRHLDHLVNLARRVSRALFFFHPAVWLASRCWRRAAEAACDRALVERPAQAQAYARVLLELQQALRSRRQALLAAGLYASRSEVGERIETLLRLDFVRPSPALRFGTAILLLVALLALPLGAERQAEAPEGAETAPVGIPESVEVSYAGKLRADIEEVLDSGWSFEFHAHGYFEFGDRFRQPLEVGRGARLEMIESDPTTERRLELSRGLGGEPRLRYFVAGQERALDASARRWMAARLDRLLAGHPRRDGPQVRPRPELLRDGEPQRR